MSCLGVTILAVPKEKDRWNDSDTAVLSGESIGWSKGKRI